MKTTERGPAAPEPSHGEAASASVPRYRPGTEYRAMPRNLPDREPFASLSPNGKLLLLILRLSLGPAGIEIIPPRRFAATFEERTGLAPAAFKRAVAELREAKCLEIEGSVVWCIGQLAEDPLFHSENLTQRTKIRRDIAMLPDQPIRQHFKAAYPEWFR